jgi:hypothetical protein
VQIPCQARGKHMANRVEKVDASPDRAPRGRPAGRQTPRKRGVASACSKEMQSLRDSSYSSTRIITGGRHAHSPNGRASRRGAPHCTFFFFFFFYVAPFQNV